MALWPKFARAKNMKVITQAELAQHNGNGDVWMAIHGLVYDTSKFMEEHPGGPALRDLLFLNMLKDAQKLCLLKLKLVSLRSSGEGQNGRAS